MPSTNSVDSFFAGAVGGIASEIVGHPFDTIKVRLQTLPPPGQKPLYSGTFDCLRQTIKKEGLLAVYKGMGAPVAIVAPHSAMFFAATAFARRLQQEKPGDELTFLQNFNAGAFAGFCATVFVCPAERIKCLLQVQSASRTTKYHGPLDAVRKLYKHGGIRSIYRGSFATLLRDIPSSGAYISTYEFIKKKFSNGDSPVSPLAAFAAGGFAGIANWIVCIPADVIKTRLQTAPDGMYPNGIKSVILEIVKNDGWLGFYRGFVPVILPAFPASAACFVCVELTLSFIRRLKEQ